MIKNENNYKFSDITEKIIGEAFKVYNTLGFGFLEKVYENALCKKLRQENIKVEQQYPINVFFEGELVGQYFADLLVEDKIIVELKACDVLLPVFEVQLINYLKATRKEVGLLINFGKKLDIKRKVFSVNHKIHKESA
jgi:GxxExxY protein